MLRVMLFYVSYSYISSFLGVESIIGFEVNSSFSYVRSSLYWAFNQNCYSVIPTPFVKDFGVMSIICVPI
jgi:hypothetical protein